MKWVKWTDWTDQEHYIDPSGEMSAPAVEHHIRNFGEKAAKLLRETGADHVVYAVKQFGADGEVDEVEFHMLAMSDAEFEERATNEPGAMVYAHHARK